MKYFKISKKNFIHNCPMTIYNTKKALHIYGSEVAKLKSNMTHQNPMSINELTHIPVPNMIMNFHPNVNLLAD